MKWIIPFAALSWAAASFASPETRLENPPSNQTPRDPIAPFEPPAQSIPQPLPGRPAPPPVASNEGTGRPSAPKSDADLARGLTASLLDDPSAPAVMNLQIVVFDGKATLRGTVRSQKEKDIATAKAGAVAGLRNVRNEITVTP